MLRTALTLLLGASLGGAAIYVAMPKASEEAHVAPRPGAAALVDPAGPARASRPVDGVLGSAAPAARAPIRVEDRLAVYGFAAVATDLEALEAAIEQVSGWAPSEARRFTLDALLARLAELDAPRAVRFAADLYLETRFRVPIYRIWAESDAPAALAALAAVANPGEARVLGLALVEVLGADDAAVSRVLAELPGLNEQAFRLDVLAERAEVDPFAAFNQALAWPDEDQRGVALRRLAGTWARRDPLTALAQVYAIPDSDQRPAFEAAVLQEWSRLDPGAALEYIADGRDGGAQRQVAFGALQIIAREAPELLLASADRLPSDEWNRSRLVAVQTLTARDPVAAQAFIDELPPGQQRQQLQQEMARAYGQSDPDAALAWAQSLDTRSRDLLESVVLGISFTDRDRALDLALEDTLALDARSVVQQIALRNRSLSGANRDLADRLLGLDPGVRGQSLEMFVATWSMSDSAAALDWLVSTGDRLGGDAYARVARQLGQRSPELAAPYAERVPAAFRGDWIASVASGYARLDADAAMTWIRGFQGQAGYDEGLAAIASVTAGYDPAGAARLLTSAGDSLVAVQAASVIGQRWAGTDASAAAAWAARLDDGAFRDAAVTSVAGRWARDDLPAATQWVLGMEPGGGRDDVLARIVAGAAAGGTADATLFAAFSDDMARQQAVVSAVPMLASARREDARALIDEYVTNPTLRRQAEASLDRVGQSGIVMPLLIR